MRCIDKIWTSANYARTDHAIVQSNYVNTYTIALPFHFCLCSSPPQPRLNVAPPFLTVLLPMRLSIAIAMLLTTAIAAPQLRTPDLPPDSGQSHLSTLRHPPPEPEHLDDSLHDSNVSIHTYDELQWFAKYASAVYQILCPRPLGNTLVESVSCAFVLNVLLAHFLFLWMMFFCGDFFWDTRDIVL
jgi:hypothetical protein